MCVKIRSDMKGSGKIMTLSQTEKTGAGHGLACEKLQNSSWNTTRGWVISRAARSSVIILDAGGRTGRMLAVLCKDCVLPRHGERYSMPSSVFFAVQNGLVLVKLFWVV